MAKENKKAQETLGNITCATCDNNKDVVWRCQNCKETLCNQCKVFHLKTKALRNHKVTELANVDEESSSLFCPDHENEVFQMYCSTCDSLVCLQCITETHKQHEHKMISEIVKQNKSQLEEVFDQIKTSQIPKLEKSIASIGKMQEDNGKEKEKLKKIITSRGEDIKQAVDKIINKCRDELEHQTSKDETSLKETKEQINSELTKLKKELDEEEQKVKMFSDVDIIVKAASIKDSLTKLTKRSSKIPLIQKPKFQIGQVNDKDLEKMFGVLTFKADQTGSTETSLKPKENQSRVISLGAGETKSPLKLSKNAVDDLHENKKTENPQKPGWMSYWFGKK